MDTIKLQDGKEHKEVANGSASGNSSPLYLEQPKLRKVPNDQHILSEHGPLVDHNNRIEPEDLPSNPDLWWSKTRAYLQDPFSEFFGVFIMILFGDGVVAQVVLSQGKKGDYQSISWGWG
jgi:hypothetical protein